MSSWFESKPGSHVKFARGARSSRGKPQPNFVSRVMNVYIYFTRQHNGTTMYWTYVLENIGDKGWYIGATSDLKKRLAEHKQGYGSRTTGLRGGWRLIYCEGYINKQDAFGREKFLKSGAGRRFLKKQLSNYLK